MKKVGFMICYNEADYIKYALDSFLDFVDEMVVVEGAFKITMASGNPPRSNDGTLDILNDYVRDKKITLLYANEQEHKFQYDIGYQWAIEHKADWAIMLDADEIWTPKAKLMANSAMNNKYGALEIRVNEYCFINDFNHFYNGTYPRIFRAIPGSKFVFDNEVQFAGCDRGQHMIFTTIGRDIWHYGYVRHNKRWKMKQDCMWEKDHNPLNLQYKLEANTYIIPNDIKIYEFAGQHPDIMKQHKWYNKTAQEIIYG